MEKPQNALWEKWKKAAKGADPEASARVALASRLVTHLSEGQPASLLANLSKEEERYVKELFLLTTRPVLYVANVGEEDLSAGNEWAEKVQKIALKEQTECLILSAEFESQLSELDESEKELFLISEGLESNGRQRLIQTAYKLLNLITFFTHGPKETRAWTIVKGTRAPQAAGQIHSDFERGFIRAGHGACGRLDSSRIRNGGSHLGNLALGRQRIYSSGWRCDPISF